MAFALNIVTDITLLDINGQSVISFGTFPGSYFGGAKLDSYTFTKSAL